MTDSPPPPSAATKRRASWRDRLYAVIFESDTPAGRLFDEVLLVAILLSVVAASKGPPIPPDARQRAGGAVALLDMAAAALARAPGKA